MVKFIKDEIRPVNMLIGIIADVHDNLRHLDKAIASYEDFVAQFPDSKIAKQSRFQIAKLYLNKGDIDKSKEISQKILLKYANDEFLCANTSLLLASCYEKKGEEDLAQ